MKSILFLIPTLDRGGAENVLLNLVNSLDQSKYEITVQTLFDKNSQKALLHPGIRYKSFLYKQFHGNSKIQAFIPAKYLYRILIKDKYDIVISYLEGPTSHILSGCPFTSTKRIAWIHVQMNTLKQLSVGFQTAQKAIRAYQSFDKLIFVANTVKDSFERISNTKFPNSQVLYNTVNSSEILSKSKEEIDDISFSRKEINIISVGRIISAKGFDRLAKVQNRLLKEGIHSHVYILGSGGDQSTIEQYLYDQHISGAFTFLGFKENPYKYIALADLFVCSSRREGFSTAVTEALVLGIPVVSTNCSGAYELLGENNDYGIVTENNLDSLYQGVKRIVEDPRLLQYYKDKAKERGRQFSQETTVGAVERMLDSL